MKIILFGLIALFLLSCNQVVEKPIITKKADSITIEENNRVQRDTLKPIKLENGKELLLDSAQLSNLIMYFAYDDELQIIPEIQMYAISNPYYNMTLQHGYFLYSLIANSAYSFSDTLIICGVAESESGSSIVTIWKKAGEKYKLISALNKSLKTYAQIDSVFNLGGNKYLLAGSTGWGDGGEVAGSIWFAVWELPVSFRMIYYDKWFTEWDENKIYSYNYTFDIELLQISLEKMVVNFKSSDHYQSAKHSDWKASKSIINVNLSSKIDKTSDFNSYDE